VTQFAGYSSRYSEASQQIVRSSSGSEGEQKGGKGKRNKRERKKKRGGGENQEWRRGGGLLLSVDCARALLTPISNLSTAMNIAIFYIY